MFLGQEVSFTRSGLVLSGFGANEVGTLRFTQSGYESVTLNYRTITTTYPLEEGYNLISFANTVMNTITLTFNVTTPAGTESVDWSSLKVYTTDILLLEANRENPGTFNAIHKVPEALRYGTATKIVSELQFEWRQLPWSRVDELEVLFDRHSVLDEPSFVLIPEETESERYNVVITSPFDFYPSLDENFNGGASGALVFETID